MEAPETGEVELRKLLGVKEAEIRRAYREYRLTVPRGKRKYMIPYSEFRRRYLSRLKREREETRQLSTEAAVEPR